MKLAAGKIQLWFGLFALLVLGACGDGLSPRSADATGFWKLEFILRPSDFTLNLIEASDGSISGSWSFPGVFANNPVRGRRDGLDIELTPTSPNIFPAYIDARFTESDRMEGRLYFGGTSERIILQREDSP